MADNNQTKPNGEEEEGEKKIPVFTVLKNNAILKNIFLLDNPPVDKSDQETTGEEILTVGRHPDCTIMLTHPSISRFHLRIHSDPSSQKLSVIDLSSVHGTWVSDNKIKPGFRVELNEGDTIRMGGSSRVYKLYWVPLSRAYDLENLFLSPSDLLTMEEKEEENVNSGGDNLEEEAVCEDDDSLLLKNKELQLLDSISEVVESLFPDENLEYFVKREVPSAPPMPMPEEDLAQKENLIPSFEPNASEAVNFSLPVEGFLLGTDSKEFDNENQFLVGPNAAEAQPLVVTEVLSEREYPELWSLPSRSVLLEIENQQFEGEIQSPTSLYASDELPQRETSGSPPLRSEKKMNLPSIWSRRGKPASVLQIQTGKIKRNGADVGAEPEVDLKNGEGDENQTIAKNLCFDLDRDAGKIKRNGADIGAEPEVDLKNGEGDENQTIAKNLFFGLDRDEDEAFTPDKENLTPMMSQRRKGKAEEKKHLISHRLSSSKVVSPNIGGEDMFASSDKENQTPKVLQERKAARSSSTNRVRLDQALTNMKRRAERVPFQSLLLNSAAKSKSEAPVFNTSARSSSSVNCGQSLDMRTNLFSNKAVGEGKRWYMVVDTSSLLNRESRKALQLLQGLKGTQLIIPRMVVRELDSLKRRASLFRRMTDVSSVLQWIEECMVSTNWWIHVQSSLEEGRPIAPTPPASPRSRYSEGSGGIPSGTTYSQPFSACGSLMDVVSPTAEDHILEFALLYRRLKNDGQLVLLSNDVTLKIKAMAEGLICETAEEFRESLVNPFSERFLWAESSPRGQTWSCLDDIVLREKYYSCPLKKASKGGECIKGLKLILLHNAHYGKIRPVSQDTVAGSTTNSYL